MVIIPKEKPVIENLNSYYLDIGKLCEHYQGEIGSGGIHFKSPNSEGIIFFDKDAILNTCFKDGNEQFTGKENADRLLSILGARNFTVNIYKIDSEKVYFWARVPTATKIYKDLSTEFTDLKGLIKKMASEKLTGYIDVSIGDGEEGGIIFLNSGVILGGSYSWGVGEPNRTKESQELLIKKTKKSGGVFHVSSIPAPVEKSAAAPPVVSEDKPSEAAPAKKTAPKTRAPEAAQRKAAPKANPKAAPKATPKAAPKAASPPDAEASEPMDLARVLSALEEFLTILESVVRTQKRLKGKFTNLLKRKFVEKADLYPFLDPFAAEFEYVDHKIRFFGDAGEKELAESVFESVTELADDLGLQGMLQEMLAPWKKKYAGAFSEIGLTV